MKTYKESVINANSALKVEKSSLNGALKLLVHLLPSDYKAQINFFKSVLKDEDKYKEFAKNVRRTKKGNFSPFYCLQHWYALNK